MRTFITAQEGFPCEQDEIVVSESAKPWLAKAGWIEVSEAHTVAVHAAIAKTMNGGTE